MRDVCAALLLACALFQPASAAASCGGMFGGSSSSRFTPITDSTPVPLEPFWAPALRMNFGGGFLVTPLEAPRFAFDLMGGAFLTFSRGNGWDESSVWLIPEAGYNLSHNADAPDRHLGTLGVGLGYGSLSLALVSYVPRFVAGKYGDETVLGFRHGLSAHFLLALLHAEISHQLLRTPGGLSHEILFGLGFNLVTPFSAFFIR
jgi:hypothetical protein